MITLSNDQAEAVRRIVHWYRHDTRISADLLLSRLRRHRQVDSRSTYAIDELGLAAQPGRLRAYTMKAALMMRRNGLPATTIHKADLYPGRA